MAKYVIKRDGRRKLFEKEKVVNAILAAFNEVEGEISEYAITKANNIADFIANKEEESNHPLKIDEIQDLVENGLMSLKHKEIAKAYILYREKRTQIRGNSIDTIVKEYLSGTNEYWNTENSNKDAMVVTTQRDYLAGILSTDYARRYLLPKEVCEAHDAGIIHHHDMDYMAQSALNNCFSVDTKIITSKGVRAFSDLYDGSIIEVRDRDGKWRTATVKQFGKQILYDVKLTSGNSEKIVKCTRNHRWILKDGTVTENLQVGDRLALLPDAELETSVPVTFDDYRMFCFGFVLGDGSDNSNSKGVRVRLCGKKTQYEKYFIQAGYCKSKTEHKNGDVSYINKDEYSKQLFLSNNCWELLSSRQKLMLFLGLYAADGNQDRNGMSTADTRILTLVKDISCVAGYYISSVSEITTPTNYSEERLIFSIYFRKHTPDNKNWVVKSIKKHTNNNSTNTVWCVVEPITNSFTLDGGIVTGNCCLINLDDMLQNGTIINKIKIDKPHRLSTATTIATQIITAVASSQYGGTTITLTHLAPFVRASYERHLEEAKTDLFEYSIEPQFNNTVKRVALTRLKKEISDAVQTFNYQINSMSTSNGQSPFISVCMYLNENPEYTKEVAMLIEEFLNQRILGMKNEQGVYITPAFPKLLYFLDENNITEDSEYYYLTELAAKCTAKRMVPDYISVKKMKEYKHGDVYPCMGK